jgi:hypothetical protein
MIDTDKYEGHQPAPWRWVKPMGMEEWFLYAEQGNHSNLNHQGAGGVWLPDTFCRLGKELDPTHRDEKSTYDLIADAPLLLAEVIRLREDNKKLHDAIDRCAYRGREGSAYDLYIESIIQHVGEECEEE